MSDTELRQNFRIEHVLVVAVRLLGELAAIDSPSLRFEHLLRPVTEAGLLSLRCTGEFACDDLFVRRLGKCDGLAFVGCLGAALVVLQAVEISDLPARTGRHQVDFELAWIALDALKGVLERYGPFSGRNLGWCRICYCYRHDSAAEMTKALKIKEIRKALSKVGTTHVTVVLKQRKYFLSR